MDDRKRTAAFSNDVAVIVPYYNHAQYLAECLQSLDAQTLPPSEVVIVDDGSADDASRVCARFPGVRHLRKEHAGVSSARNLGLRETRAELVMFLDADDVLLPNALVELTSGLAKANASVGAIFGRADRFRETEDGTREAIDTVPSIKDIEPYIAGELHAGLFRLAYAFHSRLLQASVIPQCTALIRRCVYGEVGGWDEELSSVEDREMWIRIAAHAEIVFRNETIARIRRHSGNRSQAAHWLENHSNIVALLSKIRYSGHYPRALRRRARRQMATAAYVLGCRLIDARDYSGASRALRKALGAQPLYLKAWIRYLQCLVW